MCNRFHSHFIHRFHSITQLLHHSSQSKNLIAIKRLHGHLLRTRLLFASLEIYTKLIFSYMTCLDENNFETLNNCFRSLNPTNPLPFNAILSNFCRNGLAIPALGTFSFMHTNGVPLDTYALCSSLTASSSVKNVNFGKQIHAHVIRTGWLPSVFVGSSLVDLYAKLLFISDAILVFDEIPVKNTVCANALLSGYCEAKLWVEVLELVRKMPALNLVCDHFTLSAMLRACAALSAIELGRQVHAFVLREDYYLENDVFLQSSLIEMYGRCGLVAKAWQVFNLAGIKQVERKRDIVLWTSMLGAYGRNGQYKDLIELYKKMLMEGIRPDGVAFVTIISACGHTGQVELGIQYFESMTRDYKLNAGPEHYSCLVDLLCRAGELHKAWKVINQMEEQHGSISVSMWGALLSACEGHRNIELGRLAAQKALELDPHNIGIYVMLSNLYARFGMWEDISKLRELIKEKGLEKDHGCSWIEVTKW